MGRKLLTSVQTITTFRNPLADPVGTRRGPPLVRGPQFENRCRIVSYFSLQLAVRKRFGAFINVGQNRVISAHLAGLLCASL